MRHFALASVISALAMPAMASDISVTITNLSHGDTFTPLLVAAHDNGTHLFEVGTNASSNLQAMAEGGDLSGLQNDLSAVNADVAAASGLTGPGQTYTASITTASANTQLSIVAMILPTNDGFVGLDSFTLPTTPGTYEVYLNGYDAGTEANDERIAGMSAGAPGVLGIPADPLAMAGTNGSGVTTTENNTQIHIHRGILGDSDATGGPSDLDSRVHRWLNPIAHVTIVVN